MSVTDPYTIEIIRSSLEAIGAGPELDEFIEGYMSRFFRARG